MPMRLRDGRFYSPIESQHMILRDGKSVHAAQASVFNEIYFCSIHGSVSFEKSYYENVNLWRRVSFPHSRSILDESGKVKNEKGKVDGNSKVVPDQVETFGHCHYDCAGLERNEKKESLLTKFRTTVMYFLAFFLLITSKYLIFSSTNFVKTILKLLSNVIVWIVLTIIEVTGETLIYTFAVVFQLVKLPFVYFIPLAKFTLEVTGNTLIYISVFLFKLVKLPFTYFIPLWKFTLKFVYVIAKVLIKCIVRRKTGDAVKRVSPSLNLNGKKRKTRVWGVIKTTLTVLPILMSLIFLWCFVKSDPFILNPLDFGLQNGRQIFLNSKIPAWHIIPDTEMHHPISEAFNDKAPVVLHIRKAGLLDTNHIVELFQSLSSLGLHVLAPILPLSNHQILEAWSYAHNKGQNSSTYLWVDHMDIQHVKEHTKKMCKFGMPPTGVIIEASIKNEFDNIRNLGLPYSACDSGKIKELNNYRSLEIWSAECTIDNIAKKYNFLKCPVTSQLGKSELYAEVGSCVRAISKDTSFKAR